MAYPKKSVQFYVDCSAEAKSRFATLHEALGFKTKAATFEAVLFSVSLKDKIDPQIRCAVAARPHDQHHGQPECSRSYVCEGDCRSGPAVDQGSRAESVFSNLGLQIAGRLLRGCCA